MLSDSSGKCHRFHEKTILVKYSLNNKVAGLQVCDKFAVNECLRHAFKRFDQIF